jgi:hypothetical protein
MLGELTPSINNARQAARHNVEDGTNPCEQEDRRQRELDGMSHVSHVG